jgi:hypothetical protein
MFRSDYVLELTLVWEREPGEERYDGPIEDESQLR